MPGVVRCWARVAALVGLILLCVPLHLLSRLLLRRSRWPRRFLGTAGRLCGLHVRITGQPLAQDVFFVANHVSWLDILALGGASGCAFVSRGEIGRWPLIGWLAAQNDTILVNRAERGTVGDQIDALRTAIGRHQPVALFPEGTTGNGEALLPFKPALFAVLLPPPRALRIQPVWIDYGADTADIAWVGEEPALSNVRRVLARRGGTPVTLHFLDPFDPSAHPDRKRLSAEARGRIEAVLNDRAMRDRAFRGAAGPV